MTQAILSNGHPAPVPAGGEGGRDRPALAGRRTVTSRLIGALFLTGFLSYGGGFALVTSVTAGHDFVAGIPAHRTTLALGALLMLANSVVDVGKGILFYPLLARHSHRTALAYLSAMIVEVVLLSVGVIGLLVLIPLGQRALDDGTARTGWGAALGSLALQWNAVAYQVGELSLGIGCLFLCILLLRTRLIPRFLAAWGLIGYLALATGAVLEILGAHVSLALSIPGGLWEVTLGIWLLVKGFRPQAYGDTTRPREPDAASPVAG